MTGKLRAALCAGALLGLSVPAIALAQQQELGGQRRGTSSLEFLKIGVGARAEGMGEAFVSVANDPSALYWNPAGIGSLLRREIQFNSQLSGGHPLQPPGAGAARHGPGRIVRHPAGRVRGRDERD
jgi:hypothetical protein